MTAPLPTIDMRVFSHGTAAEREAVADAFDAALCGAGFCYLVGYEHLLPAAAIEALRRRAAEFFAEPAEVKRMCHVDGTVGYLGPGAENVAATAGEPSSRPDPVESLNLPAYQDPPWHAAAAEAECPWRHEPWLPAAPTFGAAAVHYFGGATALLAELMRLAEVALALPPRHFDACFARPGTLLRVAYYPPAAADPPAATDAAPQEEGGSHDAALRYGAHTDFDGFTLLQRGEEESGGLQIEVDGEWTDIPAPPNTLTLNIGDLFARWTNDRWRSTRHRVATPSRGGGAGRLAVVYFTGPHPDTLVECLPSAKCAPADGAPPKYEPITAYEHVLAKMEAATRNGREAAAAPGTDTVLR